RVVRYPQSQKDCCMFGQPASPSTNRGPANTMKTFLYALLVVLARVDLYGQGTVTFANVGVPFTNVLTMMPIAAGTAFRAGLYYLPDHGVMPPSSDFDLANGGVYLGANVNFLPGGVFNAGTRTTPATTPPGGSAWFQVRLWETAFGTSYEAAFNN